MVARHAPQLQADDPARRHRLRDFRNAQGKVHQALVQLDPDLGVLRGVDKVVQLQRIGFVVIEQIR